MQETPKKPWPWTERTKAIRVAIAFEGWDITVCTEDHETFHELKTYIVKALRRDDLLEQVTILRAKKKDGNWLRDCDGGFQLFKKRDIPTEAWEVLDNADNVMDPHAMVGDAECEFQTVYKIRSMEFHVVVLLPQYRERSKGIQEKALADTRAARYSPFVSAWNWLTSSTHTQLSAQEKKKC